MDDIGQAAGVFLDELVRIKPGESMLVCTDEITDADLLAAIRSGVMARGGKCHVVETLREQSSSAMAERIVEGVRRHAVGVVCELGDRTYYRTQAWDEAIALGARIYSLAHLDTAGFLRCVAGVDHAAMMRFGERLYGILRNGRHVRVRTAAGTDLVMKIRQGRWQRVVKRITRRRGAWTWRPTGILSKDLPATFLGGQLSFRPEQDSLRGIAVIDGFLWPPDEAGRLAEPITWEFHGGTLVSVQAPRQLEAAIARHLGAGPTLLEHFSIGFHPCAKRTGGIHEAERVSGGLVVGVGTDDHHADGVMTAVTIDIDGVPLVENGVFAAAVRDVQGT